MTTLTEDEDAAQYADKFGTKDGQIVQKLTNKVINLTMRWQMFLYFFAGARERVDVLNEASGLTSRVLQGLFWDDALLRIRQMTDLAKTGRDENLSLQQFVIIAKRFSFDLETAYQQAMSTCKPAKVYANKYLAHLDLPHSLGDLKISVARGATTDAISGICKFVQEFHTKVRGTTHLLVPILHSGNHQQFLLRLYQGNQAAKNLEAASLAAAKAGNWSASNRTDIPDWILERREPMGLF